MKYIFIFLLVGLLPVISAQQQKEIEKITSLIQGLPGQNRIAYCKSLIQSEKPDPHDLKEAKSDIEKVKAVIPKLRALIKVGNSVFDYPGLLSKGNIHFNEFSNEYSIYLGVYMRQFEGKTPYDFRVIFDDKGKVIKVEDVVWKK